MVVFIRHFHPTLGARDFSSGVSGFCQVFRVTRAKSSRKKGFSRGFGLRSTPKIPTAREKNLWYPGYFHPVCSPKLCVNIVFSSFFTFLAPFFFPPVSSFPCPHYLSLGLRGWVPLLALRRLSGAPRENICSEDDLSHNICCKISCLPLKNGIIVHF